MRRHPEPGCLRRVEILPGARRRRRHESSPHTQVTACMSVPFTAAPVPLDRHRRISGGPQSPHLLHLRHGTATFRLHHAPLGMRPWTGPPTPRQKPATGSLPPNCRESAAS
ncbi:hypothetical protein STVIR_5517 [Streptomyces viridochromogenes Tue57]|uniref:Uncharacterized protein n=1 Tax=Streptomyces viridochromogenes Tue57 TaxID=1160705 RepID=L8PE26_STRVR|nr:hypothetical protein STVIR_5517 [Streptomyces viridochromogenes Tue57]